eukprot:6443796-Prymnesium_polylepis.3
MEGANSSVLQSGAAACSDKVATLKICILRSQEVVTSNVPSAWLVTRGTCRIPPLKRPPLVRTGFLHMHGQELCQDAVVWMN